MIYEKVLKNGKKVERKVTGHLRTDLGEGVEPNIIFEEIYDEDGYLMPVAEITGELVFKRDEEHDKEIIVRLKEHNTKFSKVTIEQNRQRDHSFTVRKKSDRNKSLSDANEIDFEENQLRNQADVSTLTMQNTSILKPNFKKTTKEQYQVFEMEHVSELEPGLSHSHMYNNVDSVVNCWRDPHDPQTPLSYVNRSHSPNRKNRHKLEKSDDGITNTYCEKEEWLPEESRIRIDASQKLTSMHKSGSPSQRINSQIRQSSPSKLMKSQFEPDTIVDEKSSPTNIKRQLIDTNVISIENSLMNSDKKQQLDCEPLILNDTINLNTSDGDEYEIWKVSRDYE